MVTGSAASSERWSKGRSSASSCRRGGRSGPTCMEGAGASGGAARTFRARCERWSPGRPPPDWQSKRIQNRFLKKARNFYCLSESQNHDFGSRIISCPNGVPLTFAAIPQRCISRIE